MKWRLGLAALVLYGLWALLWVLADIARFRADAWVEAWSYQATQAASQGQAFRPREADWAEAHALAQWACRLSPFSPDHQESLARIYEYRDLDRPTGDPAARATRLQALNHYRQAAQRRPTWPYVQASIAAAKARLGEWDAEFEQAMVAAVRLGPWEPELMLSLVDVGLASWPELTPAGRQLVIDTVLRSQSWDNGPRRVPARQVWSRVTAHGKQAAICGWMPRQGGYYQEFCDASRWPEPLTL